MNWTFVLAFGQPCALTVGDLRRLDHLGQREVAGDQMAGEQLPRLGHLRRAAVGGARAAGAEPAPGRRVDRRRRLAAQRRRRPPRARLGRRDRVEQRLCVGVQRLLVNGLARSDLAELAEIHDADPVADLLDQGEVVRDEQIGEAELAAELLEEVEHLRLDQHVERGDRLVADEQRRLERDRAGDRDPLRLPARQLARVPLAVPGRVEADQVEQLVDPLAAGPLVACVVGDERLLDDRSHVPLGVKRPEWVLEHELDVPSLGQQVACRAAWSARCRGTSPTRTSVWGPAVPRGRALTCLTRSRRRCRASHPT